MPGVTDAMATPSVVIPGTYYTSYLIAFGAAVTTFTNNVIQVIVFPITKKSAAKRSWDTREKTGFIVSCVAAGITCGLLLLIAPAVIFSKDQLKDEEGCLEDTECADKCLNWKNRFLLRVIYTMVVLITVLDAVSDAVFTADAAKE